MSNGGELFETVPLTNFHRSTRKDDQILLMRSVIGVVLRRDLSLSRRLYTWLLGPSDASETQVEYLKQHGLDLLRAALQVSLPSYKKPLMLLTLYRDTGRNGGAND